METINDTPKKKPGRPKGSTKQKRKSSTPKGETRGNTPEAQEKVRATQFKPGESGNKSGWNFRKPTRQFREACHALMIEHGVKMLINLMWDAYENGDAEATLDIIKFVTSYAYGNPSAMANVDDPEVDDSKQTLLPKIVVSRDIALKETGTIA